MDSLRTWALLALIPASILVCLSDLSTFQLAKAVLVGPVLAVLLISRQGAIRPSLPVLWAAALVPLVGVAALLRWVAPGTGAWELWLDLLFLGAVVMGAQLGGARQRLLLAAVAAGGGAVVAVTALEAVGVGPLCPAAIAKAGTMGNPNFSGAVLALAAPASLALAIDARQRSMAAAWTMLVLVVLATAVLLGTWTGAVGAGVGLVAVTVHRVARRHRSAAAAAAVLVVLGAGAALLSPTVRGHLADRGYMARVSLGAAAAQPLTGHGLGGFPRAFLDAQAEILKEKPDERGRWTRALHAHSEPLHALVERGLFGLLAWLGLWSAIAYAVWRGKSPGLTGVLAAGLALSLGEFPGHLVPIQLALGLAAGAVASRGILRETRPSGMTRWQHLLWIPALLLFLIPAWLAASDSAFNRGDPANALRINPWNGRAAFAVALAEQEGGAPTGCAHALLAERLLPSPASAMALGLCEARRGNGDEGIEALRRATRWNPRNAAAHANLAVLLLEAGDIEAARSHAIRAHSLRPGDPKIRRIYDALMLE